MTRKQIALLEKYKRDEQAKRVMSSKLMPTMRASTLIPDWDLVQIDRMMRGNGQTVRHPSVASTVAGKSRRWHNGGC